MKGHVKNLLTQALQAAEYNPGFKDGEGGNIGPFTKATSALFLKVLEEAGIQARFPRESRYISTGDSRKFEAFMLQQGLPFRFSKTCRQYLRMFDYAYNIAQDKILAPGDEGGRLMRDILKLPNSYTRYHCDERYDQTKLLVSNVGVYGESGRTDAMVKHLQDQGFKVDYSSGDSSFYVLACKAEKQKRKLPLKRGNAYTPQDGAKEVIFPEYKGKTPADFAVQYYGFVFNGQEARLKELLHIQRDRLKNSTASEVKWGAAR